MNQETALHEELKLAHATISFLRAKLRKAEMLFGESRLYIESNKFDEEGEVMQRIDEFIESVREKR